MSGNNGSDFFEWVTCQLYSIYHLEYHNILEYFSSERTDPSMDFSSVLRW